ncbi:WD40-repeat-containing domain protein [Fusarium solani]|uniref:WD40-repeat-containing domain protein n=1 Tax=Fusarium solani TaxID=169388 RepID=A0A9P9L412_FUSSL|nr:WD40-repeat-containing domain protein [Fusarium solani]KAH7273612.1 WD40-repeat-containing domain protein [Fusarium solani]
MPESRLTREFFQGPITALAFIRGADYLLAGEDTHLTLYDIKLGNAVRVASVRIFSAQPIHGIRPLTSGRVLVWGSAQVAVVYPIEALLGEGANVEDVVVKKTTAPDWIYDVSPSPYHDSSAVLATAHNEVVHLSLDDNNIPGVGAVVSPSRPILYAASLKWIDQDSVLFAGGTVFGEIVVWKCHVADGRSEMLATLSGHEGSLFGLNISDELVCQDGSAIRLLVSCSDDRTVRVWDITKQHGTTDRKQLDFAAPRETGFGSTPNGHDGSSQDAEALRPIATVMGHASRIWGVKFAELAEGDLLPQSPVTIYSFGEDSTAQRWQLDLAVSPKGLSGSLKHKETFAVHDGKHLWSHAVTRRDHQTIIATGGADSKISLITQSILSSSQSATAPTHDLTSLEFQQVLDQLPNLRTIQHVRGREIFSRYTFLSEEKVLATSSWGRLILGTFRPSLNWTEVDIENEVIADLQSCYTMKTIGDDAVILGTTNGSLYCYRQDQGVTHIGTVPGKVFNISLLAEPSEGPMELIVHLHGTADAQYLSVDWRTGAVLETADIRGMDSRFVAMSAARVKKDLIAIGSRHGFLSLLRQAEEGYRPVLNFRFNSSDAITALVPLPATDGEGAPSYFLATSRDTKYRIYEVEDLGSEVRLHLQHEVAPPFASIIEGGWFTPDASPELVLFGFKSKNFVVWNETRREEIAAVDCGGSHRTFTLAHDPTDYNRIRFGFTKTSKLCVYSQHSSIHRPLRQGTHGREIRALSSSGRYIATGAEDTTVRVWGYEEGKQGQPANKGLRCLASAKLHISGLQKTQWLGDEYLLSSAGYEEFFIWSVRRLESCYQGLGLLCEAGLDDKSPAGDLRIVDFDACKIDSQNSIIITLAMSNSTLKTYRYTPGHGFKLLARMSYTGACLTQVRHLGVDENGLSALTASTDGHLATWEASFDDNETSSHVLVHVAPLHQNSIKSLDLQPTSEGFQVLTGGDDNALGITTITPLSHEAGNRRYTVSSRGIVRKAHAAAINGLVLVRRGGETFGATVSNDQRIKIWRVQQDKTQLLADEYSGVADPGDIAVIDGPGSDAADRNQGKLRFVVGGVGAEVWSW